MPELLPALRRGGRGDVAVDRAPAPSASERKEVILSSYYQQAGVTGTPGRPWPIDRAVAEGWGRIPWLYRAVEHRAGCYSRLPVMVVDSKDKEITDHPVAALLNVKANPLEAGRRFRHRQSQQVDLSPKGAFIEITRSNAGTPLRVDLLPPARTRIVAGPDGGIERYEVMPIRPGGQVRYIDDPSLIMWVGRPHPTDAYACQTPLGAAGMSAELDHFARLYNRSFMANDGRPGGVLGLTSADDDMDDTEMDRVERKFGGGPLEAGRLVVLASGLNYVDMNRSPRDMQWAEAMDRAKLEMLSAYGVPESQLPNASGRTFDNADAEAVTFWTGPMSDHNDLCLSPFSVLLDDPDLSLRLDVSSVAPLYLAEQKRRAELREELAAGVLTIDEYREATGRRPFAVAGTRVLWKVAGYVPIAETPDEQVEAEKLAPVGAGTQAAPMSGGAVPLPPGGGDATDAAGDGGPRQQQLAAVADDLTGPGTKALPAGRGADLADPDDEVVRTEAEDALATVLSELTARMVEQAIGRVQSQKVRRGTRHAPAVPGLETKALDPSAVLDVDDWAQQAQQAAAQTLTPYAGGAAERLQEQLADDGVDTTLPQPDADTDPLPPPGQDGLEHPAVDAAVVAAALLAGDAVRARAALIRLRIGSADAAGAPMSAIVAALRGTHETLDDGTAVRAPAGTGADLASLRGVGPTALFARSLARSATTTAVEGARDLVYRAAGSRVERTWRTRGDSRVRHTHAAVEGKSVLGNGRWTLMLPDGGGSEDARFPGDPDLSMGNRIGCRCTQRHRLSLKGFPDDADPETKSARGAWDEAKHPRGHAGNKGEFASSPVQGSSGKDDHIVEPHGLTFTPGAEHTHARCRHGEVKPIGQFPTTTVKRPGERGSECRQHRDERRAQSKVPHKAEPPEPAKPAKPAGKEPEVPPEPAKPAVPAHVAAVAEARAALPDNLAEIGKRRVPLLSTDESAFYRAGRANHTGEDVDKADPRAPDPSDDVLAAQINARHKAHGMTPPGPEEMSWQIAHAKKELAACRDRFSAHVKNGAYGDYDPKTDTVAARDVVDQGKFQSPGDVLKAQHQTVLRAGQAVADEIDRRMAADPRSTPLAERSALADREAKMSADVWSRMLEPSRNAQQARVDLAAAHGLDHSGAVLAASWAANPVYDPKRADVPEATHVDGSGNYYRVHSTMSSGNAVIKPIDAIGGLGYSDLLRPEEMEARGLRPLTELSEIDAHRRAVTAKRVEVIDAIREAEPKIKAQQAADEAAHVQRKADLQALTAERMRVETAHRTALREHTLATLAEVRPMGTANGAKMNITSVDPQYAAGVELAQEHFPSDWLTRDAHIPITITDNRKGRGDCGSSKKAPTRITLSKNNPETAKGMGQPDGTRVATHEFGHHMESHIDGLTALEFAHYASRTQTPKKRGRGVVQEPLAHDTGYKADEKMRRDDFVEIYTGKEYRAGGIIPADVAHYEIFTTGIESLTCGSPYLDDSRKADAGTRALILGALATL